MRFIFFPGFILLLGLAAPLSAATLTVTTTNDTQDANDGQCSLREAITTVNTGVATDTACESPSSSNNVIQLSDTTYCLNSELMISGSVTLSGSSGGSTTLDGGNGNTTQCATASQNRILSITTAGITVELNNIILQGGKSSKSGGGIYLSGTSTLNLNQSQVLSNQASSTESMNGGAIYATQCEAVTLTNSLVDGNTATASDDRSFGGGMSATFCNSVTIENTTFNQNESQSGGMDKGAYGGGLFMSEVTTMTLTNSTFSNNKATHTGTSSTESNAYGGGVYVSGQTANIVNATINGNKSEGKENSYGGGLFAKREVIVNIAHSTIAYNEAGGSTNAYGGGVAHFPANSEGVTDETIKLINTILSDNVVSGTSSSKGANCYEKTYTLGNNLFSTTDGCRLDTSLASGTVTDYTNSNADLSSLANNGGPVKTDAISASSSAKDKGTCLDASGNPVTTDARGATRDSLCDIGSYEYGGTLETEGNGDDSSEESEESEESNQDTSGSTSQTSSSGCSLITLPHK